LVRDQVLCGKDVCDRHVEPELGPLAVSYVFLLAVVGPIAARLAEPVADALVKRFGAQRPGRSEETA